MSYKNKFNPGIQSVKIKVKIKRLKRFYFRLFPGAFKKYVQKVKDLGNPVYAVDYDNQEIVLMYNKIRKAQ